VSGCHVEIDPGRCLGRDSNCYSRYHCVAARPWTYSICCDVCNCLRIRSCGDFWRSVIMNSIEVYEICKHHHVRSREARRVLQTIRSYMQCSATSDSHTSSTRIISNNLHNDFNCEPLAVVADHRSIYANFGFRRSNSCGARAGSRICRPAEQLSVLSFWLCWWPSP
jgi:hypothetical protein